MSTPYQKLQPHFPDLSMKEVETLIGDTWDFYCNRDLDNPLIGLTYIRETYSTPDCVLWSEEKWLYEVNRLIEARKAKQAA